MDLGPFFYIAITVYYLLVLFTFLQTTMFYHSICSILCLQQTGEIDNLTVSWDKVLGCVVWRFHVVASVKLHTKKLSGAIFRSVAKLAGINLWKFGSFSYWFDKPWFHNWGKTCCCAHHNLLLGFPTGRLSTIFLHQHCTTSELLLEPVLPPSTPSLSSAAAWSSSCSSVPP
jgi:hypothetical protein